MTEKVSVFEFKCVEGDNKYRKLKLFGKRETMNKYINEFIENKLAEGWERNEFGEYCKGNSEKYIIDIDENKTVHY